MNRGKELKALRKQYGITQRQLAEGVPVNISTVTRFENGRPIIDTHRDAMFGWIVNNYHKQDLIQTITYPYGIKYKGEKQK